MDAGFDKSTNLLLHSVIRDILIRKCGYTLREILVFGFGQGGMAALVGGEKISGLDLEGADEKNKKQGKELGGIISIGAAYPLSLAGKIGNTGQKNRTPVLILAGRDSEVVTESAVKRTKEAFEFVEVHEYKRRGDTMPRSREEMLPVMQFFGRRLRSWQGVPEGSVELS